MSTEIKPGQVWAWYPEERQSSDPFEIVSLDRDMAGYKYSPTSPRTYHAPQVLIREKATLIKDVVATPASLDPTADGGPLAPFEGDALDPSKVKAGDTVTLNIDPSPMEVPYRPYSVRGEVYPIGESLFAGGWPITGHPSVTLTAHQPAPEPEPERVSGEVAIVKFDDMSGQHRAVYKRGEHRGGIWELLAGGHDAYADETTVVRPLVVIDPAAVDVDALAEALRREWSDKDLDVTFSWSDIAKTVVSALGLDGAS